MHGFTIRYFLIILVGILGRAIFYTGSTAGALVLKNVPGLLRQGDLKVSCFSFDIANFGIRQDLYIGMPADLDQFGCEYSDGAVVGRKRLVQLGHMAADGRRLVDQVNLKARSGKIKRGLNTADSSTDNHHIAKIVAFEAFANAVCETFANLVFNFS